jgi:hypothetical protein
MELVLSRIDSPATTITIPPAGVVVPVPKGQWRYGAVHTTIFLVENDDGDRMPPAVLCGGAYVGLPSQVGVPGAIGDTFTLGVHEERCVAWQADQSEAVRWGCLIPLNCNGLPVHSAIVVCVRFLPSLHLNRAQVESMERRRMAVAHRVQDRPTDTSPA